MNLLQCCFCFFIFWCFGCEACESYLPDQGSNLHPLHWKAKSELKVLAFLKRTEGSGHTGPKPFQVTFGWSWAALPKMALALQFAPHPFSSPSCSALGSHCSLYLLLHQLPQTVQLRHRETKGLDQGSPGGSGQSWAPSSSLQT